MSVLVWITSSGPYTVFQHPPTDNPATLGSGWLYGQSHPCSHLFSLWNSWRKRWEEVSSKTFFFFLFKRIIFFLNILCNFYKTPLTGNLFSTFSIPLHISKCWNKLLNEFMESFSEAWKILVRNSIRGQQMDYMLYQDHSKLHFLWLCEHTDSVF